MQDEHGWPFQSEWEKRQREPMPMDGIDGTQCSPYAIDRLPALEQEAFFERKEVMKNEKTNLLFPRQQCEEFGQTDSVTDAPRC